MLKEYLKKILELLNRGDAREESFYTFLVDLLQGAAKLVGKGEIQITPLPKKTEAGNPDFRVWDGKQHIVGYIEAKAPTIEHLDRIEESEQVKRYRHTFSNLILTNFFEFRLYRNGNKIDGVLIGRPFTAHKLRTVPPVENEAGFLALLERFFSFSLPKVHDAETLAKELAKRTRFIRDEVVLVQLKEEAREKSPLTGFYEAFRRYLISDLTPEGFADLYSQTLTYGLFAARTRSTEGFNRKLAYDKIPHTIGILRDIFQFISLGDLPKPLEWIVDDIAEVLAVTDVNKILHQYFNEGKGKDPVVHFYETFLAEYDPETREKRGVYYTPEPVVSYIVRSLHSILKEYFKKPDGFANTGVTVLDPAAGTLSFLAEAVKLAVEEFVNKCGEGGRKNFIQEHILKNFYAFELMMAPYAVGHLRMAFLLNELGYRLQEEDRFKFYLTNTLEMEGLAEMEIPGLRSLSEESHQAGKVKKETPILVILGNPPYSGISANMKPEMVKFLKEDQNGVQSYYKVDGKQLKEKKLWLQDDYVKFIHFAQWKIAQAGEGVLGFITNHSYLDNPTFRGMRQSLMKTFNEIYILDLHGNSLKKEKCPDGSKDENVFDIKQGVAIGIFIKKRDKKGCQVYHSEIWGLREKKYNFLSSNDINTIKWRKIIPKTPYYFLAQKEEKGERRYEKYWKVNDIFSLNVTGIITARDHFVIDFNKDSLKARIMTFRNKELTDEFIKQGLRLKENYMWRVSKARKELMAVKDWENYFTKILYRPFDIRYIYFHDSVVWRTRKDVMRHMVEKNLGLILSKRYSMGEYNYAFVGDKIIEGHVLSGQQGITYLFPLYLYPEPNNPKKHSSGSLTMVFDDKGEYQTKRPNLSPKLIEQLTESYKKTPTPEQIFFYIYAVLYSNTYRRKYAEFLKTDFPRIPFTKNYKLFLRMAEYGKKLVDLHLLKAEELEPPVAKFQGKGDNKVEKVRYDQGKVFINKEQHFEGIKQEVWNYQIGGYPVCAKWLKDRKGRRLSLEEIKHYCLIVSSLQKTIAIQKLIDNTYPEIEGVGTCQKDSN